MSFMGSYAEMKPVFPCACGFGYVVQVRTGIKFPRKIHDSSINFTSGFTTKRMVREHYKTTLDYLGR